MMLVKVLFSSLLSLFFLLLTYWFIFLLTFTGNNPYRFFEQIKEIAAKANSNVQIGEAVISVPSWFTDAQKRGVTTACEIAELNCLKVVNESTAVALSFGDRLINR